MINKFNSILGKNDLKHIKGLLNLVTMLETLDKIAEHRVAGNFNRLTSIKYVKGKYNQSRYELNNFVNNFDKIVNNFIENPWIACMHIILLKIL